MQFDRNIFTDAKPSRWETFLDYALAIAIALSLCMALLHGLDALFA